MDKDRTQEELDRLWQLYKLDCERSGIEPTFSDFSVWLDERT